jgi:hypothetical protein
MTAAGLFSVCNTLVLPAWLLLLVAPRWKHTSTAILITVGLLSGAYLYLLLGHWGEAQGGFGTLDDVAKLFANPFVLCAGWIHYLAFDLFTGSWEARDAARTGLPRIALIPCLVLTFLFGPVGLGLYLLLRALIKRRFRLEETA